MFKFLAGNKGSFSIISGGETIFSSKYRWIFHLKDKKIVFMTDIDFKLWVVYYSTERFMCCTFHNNVERVNIMDNSNCFFVVGKDETTSFYTISDIIQQISRCIFPVIAPILKSNAIHVGEKYVASYSRDKENNEIDVQIFDMIYQQIMVNLKMFGTQMRGCQLIENNTIFFIYTDIECLYISVNREIILRTQIEIIGNIIFIKKKIGSGFEVYLFDIRKNDIVHSFLIPGTNVEFNHLLTLDDSSMVFRASTECSECEIVVI
jgi:hypothetical protein